MAIGLRPFSPNHGPDNCGFAVVDCVGNLIGEIWGRSTGKMIRSCTYHIPLGCYPDHLAPHQRMAMRWPQPARSINAAVSALLGKDT